MGTIGKEWLCKEERKKEEAKKKEKRKEKEKNWYGITSMCQHTERVKAILRREGLMYLGKEEKH